MEVIALILAFILGFEDFDLETAEWGLKVIGWAMLLVLATGLLIYKGTK